MGREGPVFFFAKKDPGDPRLVVTYNKGLNATMEKHRVAKPSIARMLSTVLDIWIEGIHQARLVSFFF